MAAAVPIDRPEASRLCPRCGGDNRCGFGQDAPCWCATRFAPRAPLDPDTAACYCARCLQELHEPPAAAGSAT